VKVSPNSKIDRFKVRLVAKDILNFFGLIVVHSHLSQKRCLLNSFSLMQLFVIDLSINLTLKMPFLHDDVEEVYME